MFDVKYWVKRPLYRLNRTSQRLLPSIYMCLTCNHHVQRNHYEKEREKARVRRGAEPHLVIKFGRRFPNKRAKQLIAQAPSIRHFLPKKRIVLPANFDLRNVNGVDYTSPRDDQGPEGSCTGHGYRNARGPAERIAETFQEEASSRMIYEDAKHRGGYSEGAMMIDIMQAAVEDGDCRDHYEPYIANDPDRVGVWPPINSDSLVDAKNWRIKDFADCMKDEDGSPAKDPIYNVMAAIYFDGKPVVVQGACDAGTPWTRSWSNAWYVGKMPIPPDNDPLDGGHSYAIIGWKTVDGVVWFIAQNSWGVTNLMGGDFEFQTSTLTCKNWQNYGGPEIYRMVDARSIICPEGQHWDSDQGVCVDDGSGPKPVDCDKQYQDQVQFCADEYLSKGDVLGWVLCVVNAIVTWYTCKYKKSLKVTSRRSLTSKKKKQLTITVAEV